jgi:hypothetical protein
MLVSSSIPQRIFIVGHGSLFDEGMTNLLTQDTSLMVSHIVYSDAVAFQNMIQHDRPDVLLICESGLLDMNEILDSVITDSPMIGLCIFVLHLGDSAIDFYEYPDTIANPLPYRRRTIIAKTGKQLINILKRKHYRPC